MIALSITAWVLLAVCAAAVAIWIVLLVRINMMLVDRPTVRDGIDLPAPPDGWPSLSIIVPAHDEQDMIDGCATLLREQEYENLQIVFVLDRCTDNTAAVLARHARADPRIVVIENESCPEDWAGKCNAARIGAEHATGDWLLFTDADTRFDPQLARAAVALARDRDLALLSLLSTLTVEHRFERIAQVAATMTLLELYPIHRTDRTKSPRPFANGQFMLFRRDWYDRIGGHDAVKDALLEDIAAAKLIARHGVRNCFLPPTALKLMRQVENPVPVSLRSVGSGGESLGAELLAWGEDALGLTINEFYGQTEANLILSNRAGLMPVKAGSMGRPVPGHVVAVVDEDGVALGPGEVGQVAVRRPDPVMFLNYWNDAPATAAKFIGDWCLTGDLAHIDTDGYFWFVGRNDDVITSAGYRIGPAEIEDCLMKHPAVAMAAAVGVPDEMRTEIVKAFIVLAPGVAGSPELARQIQEHVKSQLAAHEYPRAVEFVAELPLTATGKIMRRVLRDRETTP